MDKNKDSGIVEIVAVAALLFLFWRLFSKKRLAQAPEPATTEKEVIDELNGDPNFNLNDYCQNVIHRPLSTKNLTPTNLLGEGWCFRGDRSAIDPANGFGDAYAEEQADKYTAMKQEEAMFINNMSYVQFKLVNTTAAPITTNILNATEDSEAFAATLDVPIVQDATGVHENGFTANWLSASNALGYIIDIAMDISFLSYVTGYVAKDVGDVLSFIVSGLGAGTNFYYRVRSYNDLVQSKNSEIINVTTDFITDIDGNQYSSVIIGTQEWLTSNLKTTKYADGTAITIITLDATWKTTATEGMCYYDNDPAAYKDAYGAIYNHYAVVNAHGIAPAGWGVADEVDFDALILFLGGTDISGGLLKELGLTYWNSPNNTENNDYGFSGRGAGERDGTFGGFGELKHVGSFWAVNGKKYTLYNSPQSFTQQDSSLWPRNGFSIRCMRNI